MSFSSRSKCWGRKDEPGIGRGPIPGLHQPMKYLDEYRDAALTHKLLAELQQSVTRPWTIMEVCGGQTHSIIRSGLDRIAPRSDHPGAWPRLPGVRHAS